MLLRDTITWRRPEGESFGYGLFRIFLIQNDSLKFTLIEKNHPHRMTTLRLLLYTRV